MKVKCPSCGLEFDIKKKRKVYHVGKRNPMLKITKILNLLKEQQNWIWIRRISKLTNIKPYSVSYLIEKYINPYVEILSPKDVYESTGIKMKMIRLKNRDLNIKMVLDDLRKRINS